MKTIRPRPKTRMRVKLCALGCIAVALSVLMISGRTAPKQAGCPNLPSVTLSSTPPTDVCIPSGFGGNPIQFFDDFSWRSFVALVWPAQAGQRGIPNTGQPVGTVTGPLVYETLKADWEVFQPGGAAPSAWNSFTGQNPCGLSSIGFNDLVLASFSKFGNLGQAGFGNLVGPLVAQNTTYARYLTAFNQTEYTQILGQQLYLQANLTNVTLQNGSVDVKSSWIEMTGIAHPERYYTRTAWVLDPASGNCSQTTVGLVGLHIVSKTPSRPQWIWSTFEQVDNIPQTGAQSPFAFNDGSGAPMPATNLISFPPPPTPPTKFNVTRVKPISTSTQSTNTVYQQALAGQGTGVWQFYQLVMTQWPVPGDAPSNPGTPNFSFPGNGATTAFSNVTMETFDQNNIRTGCMNCHNLTKTASDFLWALKVNAFPSTVVQPSFAITSAMKPPPSVRLSPELRQLKALLQSTAPKPTAKPKKAAGRKKGRR
jgi:hypothetical protein